jgi:hypothetical protein
MLGGQSPVGLKEKAKGNSRGKASHESHNRLFHTQSAFLAGQTGARYELRPADLNARCALAAESWSLRGLLPEHLRGQEKYPLLLPAQAREHLVKFCLDQNFRHDHALEDFAEVLEWLDPATNKWMPQSTFGSSRGNEAPIQFRKRKESPAERALRLIAGCRWTRVSPDVIIAFLSHTVRPVTIAPSGEVEFSFEGNKIRFAPPGKDAVPASLNKALGYFNPSEPHFLYLTDGAGRILGLWLRRARVPYHDQELLAQAFRYTDAALKAAQQTAADYASADRAELDALKLHNANLARGNEFVEVAPAPSSPAIDSKRSLVAAALSSAPATRAQIKADAQAAEAADDESLRLFRQAANSF